MGNKQREQREMKYSIGLRVLKVKEESPASCTDLTGFLDYVVSYVDNEQIIDTAINENDFKRHVMTNVNRPITIVIYNVLREDHRSVTLTPSRSWKASDSLLGCLFRLETLPPLSHSSHHLTNTYLLSSSLPQSPFQSNDYLIGMVNHNYHSLDQLLHILSQYKYPSLIELCIYNPSTLSTSYICLLAQPTLALSFGPPLPKLSPPPPPPPPPLLQTPPPLLQTTHTHTHLHSNQSSFHTHSALTFTFNRQLLHPQMHSDFPLYYHQYQQNKEEQQQQHNQEEIKEQEQEQKQEKIGDQEQIEIKEEQKDERQEMKQTVHVFYSKQKQQEYQIKESDLFSGML